MRSFLSDCKRIEEIAGKLYQQLADDSSYADEVRKVFQKLSDDERAHARHIDLVLQGDEKDIDAAQMIPWEKLDDAVKLAESLSRKPEGGNLNEENALRLAVQMEQQFVGVHVHNALSFRNPKLAALFDKLGKEDEAHLNTLRECLKWWQAVRK